METTSSEFLITIDDDPIVSSIVEKATGVQNMRFSTATDVSSKQFEAEPMAVFLDIHLDNGENGLDSIPSLRNRWLRSPIIVMTCDDNAELIVNSLAAGANDFIRKPLHPLEVSARLKARLHEQAQKSREEDISFYDIRLNTRRRFIESHGNTAYFSPTETLLLETLMLARGMIVKREELKRKIWGNIHVSDNALDRKVFEVRSALKDLSSKLQVVSNYGVGFCLKVPD